MSAEPPTTIEKWVWTDEDSNSPRRLRGPCLPALCIGRLVFDLPRRGTLVGRRKDVMAHPAEVLRISPAAYLAGERASQQKHEYLNGQVFAMAGASPKHNVVCGNIIRALGDRLRGRRCAVMPSDQHVYVEATALGTYPDVTVLCGPAKHHADFPQSLVNPSILVEVLSPSTEAYDRGAKFDHYRHLDSLCEYVLVATDRFAVDHYLREPDGTWRLTATRGLDGVLRLPSVDAAVPLAEIYENLDLVAPEGIEEPSPHPPAVDVRR